MMTYKRDCAVMTVTIDRDFWDALLDSYDRAPVTTVSTRMDDQKLGATEARPLER
jgi:hypothetical protein